MSWKIYFKVNLENKLNEKFCSKKKVGTVVRRTRLLLNGGRTLYPFPYTGLDCPLDCDRDVACVLVLSCGRNVSEDIVMAREHHVSLRSTTSRGSQLELSANHSAVNCV